MPTFQQKVEEKLKTYREAYRVDELNEANDLTTLMMLIRQEVLTEDWYEQLSRIADSDDGENSLNNAQNVKRLMDAIKDSTNTVINLQRTLNIDRKTRKTEEVNSPADFIRTLKRNVKDFLDQRITKVYCPNCKIMVGRIYPVHEHTAYSCSFQCSQCGKMIRARREDKDIFFDIPQRDRLWRKHRAEIVQPKKDKDTDDLVLGPGGFDSDDLIEDDNPGIQEDMELVNGTS